MYQTLHTYMAHLAGVIKLLEQHGHQVLKVRANEQGGQITLNEPITAPMILELVDDYAEGAGYNLLGVWITWPTD